MERSRVETCELSAILLCARAAGSLGTGRHWRGCAVVRVRGERRVLTGLWFHKAGRVYYKYNVVCATWTVALLAIPYRHAPRYQDSTAERPKNQNTAPSIVHTADAATARPRHAATERIRALPARGFGLDGCPRFTLLFTASPLLSRCTGLGCRVQARGRSSPNCDKHTDNAHDNAPAQRTVKSVSVLRRKPRVARRTAANRHPDSPGIWRAPSRQRVGVRSRRTARPSWRSGGTD
jgi:hypothetical protein